MDFSFTPEQQSLIDLTRQIAKEVVAPRAAAIDAEGTFPWDVYNAFKDADLLGINIPEEYGGSGLGVMGLVLAVEQVAQYCCSSGLILLLTRLPLAPILYGGTEEQKKHYAGGVASGTLRGAFCLSEPDAGSDATSIGTTAVRQGDYYIINGTKNWISGAGQADFFSVATRTGGPGPKGISMFVVDKGTPGLTVGRKERKMGVKGVPVHQVIFEDCKVPVANMLGKENEGFKVVMNTLNSVRPVVAARGLGLAEGALMYAVAYARERHTMGKPIIEHQGLQWMMAEIAAEIDACRFLTYRAALVADSGRAGKDTAHLLSMAKMRSTELAQKAATDAIQFMGAAGYMADHPLERHYRDAKQLTIVEGTTQIQKNTIGRALVDGVLSW